MATPPAAEGTAKERMMDAEEALRDKLKKTFDTFDADHSDQVSTTEMFEMMQDLGVVASPAKIEAMVKAADTDDSGEISFEEFYEAMKQPEFAELIAAATHPADVARSLEEANTHFLSVFNDFIVETLAACQAEVLAAKVPLESYGRVHSALDAVKKKLTGTAQELLTVEFAQLRTTTIESIKAQKSQLEAGFQAGLQFKVETLTSDVHKRMTEALQKKDDAEREVERLVARSSKPEIFITKLESQLATKEDKLQRSEDKAQRFEMKLNKYEQDWHHNYPKVLEICSLPPPAPPPESPFVRILEQRGMTMKHFFDKLDRNGDGKVSKTEFRESMKEMGLSAEHLGEGVDEFFAEIDVDGSGDLNLRELTTAVQKTRINRGQAKETTLKAGLDRDYAPELVGSRLLYIVQQYEDMKKLKEDTLANEVAERKAKVTSALNSAKKLSDAAEEAWVEKEAEWQRERVTLLAKLDNEGKTAKKTAEEEKAELQAELTRQRESAEAAAMKQFRADKEELEALRSKLKENRYELDSMSKELRDTNAKLNSVTQSRDGKTEEVKQTKCELEAGLAAAEAKLKVTLAALEKSESAQPRQGGYFFAAAPLSRLVAGSLGGSREGSPTRLQSREGSPVRMGSPTSPPPTMAFAADGVLQKPKRTPNLYQASPPPTALSSSPDSQSRRNGQSRRSRMARSPSKAQSASRQLKSDRRG